MGKLKMMTAVLFNCLMGALLAPCFGASVFGGMLVANAVAVVAGGFMPQGSLYAGVLTEVWTGELVKKLRAGLEATFLDGIPDMSSLVDNEVIHLVNVGVDPDVLVNNTTYPIPSQNLTDTDISISLDKFQTKVTPVTDDELHALSYDKMSRVIESHGDAITDSKFAKAAHALAATNTKQGSNVTAVAGVIPTTGAAEDGRKKITRKDIIKLKKYFDKQKVPADGRRLVLCSDHVAQLLEDDQKFRDQYYNYESGRITKMYGFEIYEFANCPNFDTDGVKQAVGAATGNQASFAFYTKRTFKATGGTKMYYRDAQTNPEMQESTVNFRHYFICLPKKSDAMGVIYSAAAS